MLWNATAESQHNGRSSPEGRLPRRCSRYFIHCRTEYWLGKGEKQMERGCRKGRHNRYPNRLRVVVYLQVVRSQIWVKHRR